MKKTLFVIFIVLLAACTASPGFAQQSNVQLASLSHSKISDYERANMPYEAEQAREQRVRFLEKAIKEEPLIANLHLQLGQAYLDLRIPVIKAADERFQSAKSLNPALKGKIADSYIAFGKQKLNTLKLTEIYEILSQAINVDPAARGQILSQFDGNTQNSNFVLYCFSSGDQQRPYREKLLASNDLTLILTALHCRSNPIVKTYAGHLAIQTSKKQTNPVLQRRYQKWAKQLLSDKDYQAYFPAPRAKTWQTVPGSEKPFVGKGIDRNNYVLNLARWGTDIKKGYQIVITSPGNKPFYVGENSEWKKCVKTYERTIDFSTGGNNNWMQAYAENGEVLNFKLLSLK